MPFLDSLDIANRVCQRCGVQQILDINEDSKNNTEITFAYDKLRRAELRRNIWAFTIRKTVLRAVTTTTLLLAPQPWSAASTYMPGALVTDANGTIWMSVISDNITNAPGATSAWEEYFGPMTADIFNPIQNVAVAPWSSVYTYTINTQVSYNGTIYSSIGSSNLNNVPFAGSSYWQALGNAGATAYYAGELCYAPAGNPGGFVVYMSLTNGNTDVPSNITPWNATSTYTGDNIVSYSGFQWRSLIPYNLNNTPAVAPTTYDPNAIYTTGNQVTAPDGYLYISVGSSNQNNNPVTSPGYWTNTTVPAAWARTPVLYPSSTNWLPLFADLSPMPILYPLGSGPVTDTSTNNIFRLPAGYLRRANQAPKQGSVSWLGAPSGASYNDWNTEGKFIVSTDVGPIIFRFGADVTDVTSMDDMFCEGLAARIAEEVCEILTQSTSKVAQISQAYTKVMGEARTVNAIEVGSEESPEDDWVSCRI